MDKPKQFAGDYDVVIIGSGLGGLLCGYILSKEGIKVCILEKQPAPGGNLNTFRFHGSEFETGVHYIGSLDPGQTLYRYWKYFGLTDNIEFKKLDINGFDVIAFEGAEFPMAQGFSNFREQLLPSFPDASRELSSFLGKIQEIAGSSYLYNLIPPFDREKSYAYHCAFDFIKRIGHKKIHSATGITLGDVLAGNSFLYGGSDQTPLKTAALINHSFISSAHRIVGGSGQVAKYLCQKIIEMGGHIQTGFEVAKITPLKGCIVTESSEGYYYYSDFVISDIHPARTLELMPERACRPAFRKRIASLKNTVAPFILFIKLKPDSFPYLNNNYYYHNSPNPWFPQNVDPVIWPSMYLLTTGCQRINQEFSETLTILTYMRFDEVLEWEKTTVGQRGQAYLDFKARKAQMLLDLVSKRFPKLNNSISGFTTATPLTYRDYTGTPQGSLYGIQKSCMDSEVTTLTPKTKIPNLYFTGQNINLHGVLGVTIGAVMTCAELLGIDYLLRQIKSA